MSRFSNLTVSELLAALSSADPTPGGGTASAIAGAMGVSLLIMVTGLAKSKTNTDEEKASLAAARGALEPVRAELMRLADADTEAFDEVMAAYRRPKGTDDEKAARTEAIQGALRTATTTPLETLRSCAEAMRHGVAVAASGNRSASSDVGVAVGILEAAAAGAEANVRTNLPSLNDEAFKADAQAEIARLTAATAASSRAARLALSA